MKKLILLLAILLVVTLPASAAFPEFGGSYNVLAEYGTQGVRLSLDSIFTVGLVEKWSFMTIVGPEFRVKEGESTIRWRYDLSLTRHFGGSEITLGYDWDNSGERTLYTIYSFGWR